MVSPQPRPLVPAKGLPPGVEPGPLGARLVAFLIDSVVPALILVVAFAVGSVVVRVVVSVIILGWAVLVCWMLALRAASPGMRLTRLQLVGLSDGRPLSWSRVVVRALLLLVLAATVVELVVVAVFLVRHPRRQGWHDLVANAVVIKERAIAPAKPRVASVRKDSSASIKPQPALSSPERALSSPEPAGFGAIDSEGDFPAAVRPTATAGRATPTQDPTPAGGGASAQAAPEVGVSPQSQDWMAVLDDGREITIAALVLLGRNPQARPGEDDAELVKFADETRTVSKTHLALGVDGRGMYVIDRGSTNGSTVTNARGVSKPCPAGETVSVAAGNIVSFGEHWLEVRRGA